MDNSATPQQNSIKTVVMGEVPDFVHTMKIDERTLTNHMPPPRKTARISEKFAPAPQKHVKKNSLNPLLSIISDTLNSITGHFSNTADFYTAIRQESLDTEAIKDQDLMPNETAIGMSSVQQQFDFQKKIADGGQGRISQAHDKMFNRTVAIKSLHDKLRDNKDIRSLFLTESEITAQLEHPSIVPIYGLYTDQEHGLHLAMKLIQGKTLREHIKAIAMHYDDMPYRKIVQCEHKMLRQRLEFFLKICDAISYAHHRNIIHRDLKPENIMIGRFNETYIMDWGIACKFDPIDPKPPEQISGTPRYISPDMLLKRPLDQRSDIYLLGIILFEIVFLKRAFPQPDQQEAFYAAMDGDINSFTHQYNVKIDTDLKAIVQHALEYNPDNRYSETELLAKDIRNYLNDEPVSVSPHPFISNAMRLVHRHNNFLLWFIVVLLFSLITTLAIYLSREMNRHMDDEVAHQTMTWITNGGLESGLELDGNFAKIEKLMENAAREIAFRLDASAPTTPNRHFYSYKAWKDPQTAPPNTVHNAKLNALASLDASIYKLAPNAKLPESELNRILVSLQPLFMRFRNMQEFSQDTPLLKFYAGFETGLQLCYPYHSQYNDSFDPRERLWYQDTFSSEKKEVIWSDPYPNLGIAGNLVMTGSMTVFDQDDKAIGVIGVDILLENLLKNITNDTTNNQFITNKYIISKKGNILIDSSRLLSPIMFEGVVTLKQFPNQQIFNRMWASRNGYIFADSDKRVCYYFMRLKSVDWLYVERIDYESITAKGN